MGKITEGKEAQSRAWNMNYLHPSATGLEPKVESRYLASCEVRRAGSLATGLEQSAPILSPVAQSKRETTIFDFDKEDRDESKLPVTPIGKSWV